MIKPGLLVLHSNRAEDLSDAVCAWLQQQPLAPLEEEVFLVQSNGVAEWIKMALAEASGVCAATRFELPGSFLWQMYRQVLGKEAIPYCSPFDRLPLQWRIMAVLPQVWTQPVFLPISQYLQNATVADERTLQLCVQIADLFDQYQVYRPDWLQAWARGADQIATADGVLRSVPDEQLWQPALWRALLGGVTQAHQNCVRHALHSQFLERLQGPGFVAPNGLPRRIVLFGMVHMPLPTLQALAALAQYTQVILAIINPCRFHWAEIMDGRELLRMSYKRQPLRNHADLSALSLAELHTHAHPILAAWGRQARDFVRQLDAFDDAQAAAERFALPRIDLFSEDAEPTAPLLARVQARIRDLVPLSEHSEAPLAADDRSIVFHICHSAMREVEVLHDQLLHELAKGSLLPRDIVVMLPDIAQIAPIIRAVFNQYPPHDPRYIPFAITDTTAREVSPLTAAVEWLLRLPEQRVELSALIALLEVPALAKRFGIPVDGLPILRQWMAGSGLRWGLHPQQRNALGFEACGDQNSAWWALRRMLLGYASGSVIADDGVLHSPTFDGIEPYPEIGGLDAGLVGGLAQLLERFTYWWAALKAVQTPTAWAENLRTLLTDFFSAATEDERQVLQALDEALIGWLEACDQGEFSAPVGLAVAREAWQAGLDLPQIKRPFRAGGVTFCTLVPMRAIPFKVVCLLGMHDGAYPRAVRRHDFDLMALAGDFRPGDRSRRHDDRQLVLDALLSARQTFYVSWTGRSVRDNSEQPPSVLVAQLRDYLQAGWGKHTVHALSTEHPLQPFSRRYFAEDATLSTWAREWRDAHRTPTDIAISSASLTAEASTHLTCERLVGFWRNPVEDYCRQQLRVFFTALQDALPIEESFEVCGLNRYFLDDAVLGAAITAHTTQALGAAEAFIHAEIARLRRTGVLPMAAVGDHNAATMAKKLLRVVQEWQKLCAQYPLVLPKSPLFFAHQQIELHDWLSNARDGADAPVCVFWSAKKVLNKNKCVPHKLLAYWVPSVMAAAAERPVVTIIVAVDAVLRFEPMPSALAKDSANALLAGWLAGQSRPLAVAAKTAIAWLSAKPHQREEKAQAAYEGEYSGGEVQDPHLARLYPDYAALRMGAEFELYANSVYAPLNIWSQSAQIHAYELTPEASEENS